MHLGGLGARTLLKIGFYSIFKKFFHSILVPTEFDLGRSFDSISLKLGRTVVSIEDRSCIVFGPIRPNEGRAWVMQIREFLENENLTTYRFF